MKLFSSTTLFKKRFAGLAASLVLLAILFIKPNSREHEFLLLTALGSIAVLVIAVIAYQYSTRTLRALRLARRERSLFRAAADGSQQAFYLCKPVLNRMRRVVDFKIVYANAATEKLFGRSRAELLGKPVSKLLPAGTRAALLSTWSRVASGGVAEDFNMQLEPEAGNVVDHPTHVVALAGRIAISVMQTQGERLAAIRIQELNDFAQAIIESAPISMIATDSGGTIVAMNSAAEQLTQYSKQELVGQHSLVLLHEPTEMSSRAVQLSKDLQVPVAAGFESLVARPSKGEADEREWTYVRKDGSRVWVNLTMTQLRTSDEKAQGYLGIAFDITDRKRLTDSVTHMAHHDQLTGLPNRTLLHERLTQGIEQCKRTGKKMAVFMIDIDNFKRINDSLGHAGGDKLLSFISNQLSGAVRHTDTVARVGGDEFVVILADIQEASDAERCAAAMLRSICVPMMVDTREVCVTASIGCSLFPDAAETSAELLRHADTAMYVARSQSRGTFQMFSHEMDRATAGRLEMEEDLRHAVERGEIALHYQPQVRCSTGEVIGMEMLMRWNSPKRGNVPPNVFIPIAEQSGLLVTIGEWAVRKACFDCVEAERRLGTPLTMAVNLSARQYGQRNLIPLVKKALADSGLEPSHLEFEITEDVLMNNTPVVLDSLKQLRELGISVAIDDFGTGFSNFSYILQYHVDRLKIDRSFISRCLTDPAAAAIVRSIMTMAHGLKIEVVAEGVETVEQLNFLLRRKCDVAQGFLYSKAVSLDDLVGAVMAIDQWNLTQKRLTQEAQAARKHGSARTSPNVLAMPNEAATNRMSLVGGNLLKGTA